MLISIGLFAHNEGPNIGRALSSLFDQSIFRANGSDASEVLAIELLCLANGCSDDTVEVAQGFLKKVPAHVTYRVIDLPEPGKSRTWNSFVHERSDKNAACLVFMDADIVFDTDDVLRKLIDELARNPHADVATDTPVKSFARDGQSLSLADRGSLAASEQKSTKGVLCGQLYCARADVIRRVWLPPALPVEDGYLAAMIVTRGFTAPGDLDRIALVPDARHFFRTHRSVSGFIGHEARIIVGSVINSWIFTILWEQGKTGHAGAFVERENKRDGEWLQKLVDKKIRNGGVWLVPSHFMFWRLEPLKGKPLARMIRAAPIAFAATALNLIACVRANAILKRRNATAHW